MTRLGVNIDHVATIRQARGESYPDLSRAALQACQSGADQITIHLREDRRHIQDDDLGTIQKVCADEKKLFNLEMAATEEMVGIALERRPDWVCLVPEKREEKTTEGGLNLMDERIYRKIRQLSERLSHEGIHVSLFCEATTAILEKASHLSIHAVEIHTGDFARQVSANKPLTPILDAFRKAQEFLLERNLRAHAGHGLTPHSLAPLLEQRLFSEYNIGHWIIAESIYGGLGSVVSQIKDLIRRHE